MSYFLVRFLQTFSSITLAEDVQTMPPAGWAEGSNAQEKVVIKHHLTLYVYVSIYSYLNFTRCLIVVQRMGYG